ncbi:hypothetical protein MMC07_000296 [Pseudocyphellaria aurata]|nr:hypothetical protein [Pseudocyphellaria aurata]
MGLQPPRKHVPKVGFPSFFSALKTQTYHDPSSRAPGSHTIRTIAWNPSGNLIATGSADRTLRVWNPEKPQVKNSTDLKGHGGGIERVAWNPTKEAELASVSSDGTCRFWDVRNKACTAVVQLGGEGLTIAWAADGSVVMDETLVPITIHPTPTAGTPSPQPLQTNQTAFTYQMPPNTLLLTAGDGSTKILDYPSLAPLHSLHAHTSACFCLELSPTGRHLAVGGSDALISLWETTEWVCKRTLAGMQGGVKQVAFSWDGSYIVGGSDEGTGLEIAHVESGEYVYVLPTTAPAPCVAWHPSRYWLAYSGDPMGLKIVGAAGGGL